MTDDIQQSVDKEKKAHGGIWRHRGRRFGTGLNVCIAVFLAALMLVMANYLAYRFYRRWDLGGSGYYSLSGKTKGLLASLKGDFHIIAFFQRDHALFDDVRNLLREYEYEAGQIKSLNLNVEIIDPDRDLTRTRQLKRKYDLKDANVIVFDAGGRSKYVAAKDIVDHFINYDQFLVDGQPIIKKRVKMVGFRGEQVFSSAIQDLTQTRRPVVYFLMGHGECDINDYNKRSGYSSLARVMSRDNMEIKTLLLAKHRRIPEDCSAVVIAGPDCKFSNVEADVLSEYLDKNGRMFLLVDPVIKTGLESLLGKWGVKLGSGVVVGLTHTGRELVVTKYGNHPITRKLKNMVTMFYMPRSIEFVGGPGSAGEAQADKPRVSTLVSNTGEGWLETDLNQNPPKYNAGIDRPGPIPIALAVEKGPVSGIEVEIKPTRMVVIGDSYFVSNGALKGGVGGNINFFMSTMNWLLEREALMAIAPKVPGELRLDMNQKQIKMIFLLVMVAIPAAVAFIGLLVWLRRRT